jgi:hypothetical protein
MTTKVNETSQANKSNIFTVNNFTIVPNEVLINSNISKDARLLYAVITGLIGRNQKITFAYLNAIMGYTQRRALKGYLSELQKLGLLKIHKESQRKYNFTVEYQTKGTIAVGNEECSKDTLKETENLSVSSKHTECVLKTHNKYINTNIYSGDSRQNNDHDKNKNMTDRQLGEEIIKHWGSHFDVLPDVRPPTQGTYDETNMAVYLGQRLRQKNIALETLKQLQNNFATELRENTHGLTKERSIWQFWGLIGHDAKVWEKYLPEVWMPPKKKTNKQPSESGYKVNNERPVIPQEMEPPPEIDERTLNQNELQEGFADILNNLGPSKPLPTNKTKRPSFNIFDTGG